MSSADGESSFVLAARSGQDSFVKLLLDMGIDANSTIDAGQPHRIPTRAGQFVTMSELEGYFDIGSELQGFWSALHAAVQCGNLAITRVLLDNGANVDCVDAYGWSPLHIAASKRVDLVPPLLEYGANKYSGQARLYRVALGSCGLGDHGAFRWLFALEKEHYYSGRSRCSSCREYVGRQHEE
jgi:hypothetical protein